MQALLKPNRLHLHKTTITRLNLNSTGQSKNRKIAASITTLTSRGI